ncbi:MAG: carboxypeptidase [Porticoccaceae bacterium]|nr:MAG: carboxypeptidase [Porticoccaceae bacterium]
MMAAVGGGGKEGEVADPRQWLYGLPGGPLIEIAAGVRLHRAAVGPFRALAAAAAREGIQLAVASAHRDFERQRVIWEEKAAGRRPVLDREGRASLDPLALAPRERLFALLRWSAPPGASRHHWGTDLDLWDRAAGPGFRPALTPEEYAPGGPCGRLAAWLDSGVAESLGFYRPYAEDRGGVGIEPWHLSYRPAAEECAAAFDAHRWLALLRRRRVALAEEIAEALAEVCARYLGFGLAATRV